MTSAATRHRTDPRVLLVVAAASGSGKTTLLERLVPALRAAGLRVGAVKRTHHDVDVDPAGTDSRRLRDAGASPVILRGPCLTTVFAPTPVGDEIATLAAAAAAFGPLDLVVVEGGRELQVAARIEIVPPGSRALSEPAALLAVVSDDASAAVEGRPRLGRDDIAGIAALVVSWVRG